MRATRSTVLAVVAAGGALGAAARHAVGQAAGDGWTATVLATLMINVAGCLALGLLVAAVLERGPAPSPLLRAFLVTGVLGGFTTFSALALEVRDGLADEGLAPTLGYVAATLVLGTVAVVGGLRLGELLALRRGPRPDGRS